MNRMNTSKQGSKAGISTENLETLIRDWITSQVWYQLSQIATERNQITLLLSDSTSEDQFT